MNMYARALFDNQAETEDELSFKTNDMILVLEKNADEMEGWWKCKLGDKEGLCPANYLELVEESEAEMDTVYDLPRKILTSSDDTYDVLPKRNMSTTSDYDVLPVQGRDRYCSQESYDELPAAKLRHPYKLKKQPHVVDEVEPRLSESDSVYDELPRRTFSSGDYDVLPSNNNNNRSDTNSDYDEVKPQVFDESDGGDGVYDVPRNMSRLTQNSSMDEDYDIPRSHFLPAPIPKKQNTIDSINDDYDELPMKIQPTYDVIKPPIKTLISSDIGSSNGALSGLSFGSRNSIASNSSSDSTSMYHIKIDARPLSIDTDQAMDQLVKLKKFVDKSVAELLNFLTPNWRMQSQIDYINQNRSTFQEKTSAVRESIAEFVEFAQGSLATAAQGGRKKMVSTITRKLQPIEEDLKILTEMEQKMSDNGWNVEVLIDNSRERRIGVPDDLDSFVMTSRATPDDVAALASYIYTHSQNLFRRKGSTHSSSNISVHSRYSSTQGIDVDPRNRPLPTVPNQNTRKISEEDLDHGQDDYDYIQLDELSPMVDKKLSIKSPSYNRMSSFREIPGNADPTKERLISFYYQFGMSQGVLQEDIDNFFTSVKSQPPKKFVSLSKRILKRANELVFIGDATSKVFQSNGNSETVSKLLTLANRLATHSATTAQQVDRAAKVWPSPHELQTAVNLTAALSEHVRSLKHSIHNAISAA